MPDRLKQAIVDLVVPSGVIEDTNEYYATTTTRNLDPEQLEMISKLSEVGINTIVSTWPAGVMHPNLKDKTKKGTLVLRFEWGG